LKTQCECIIEAFQHLGGTRTIAEISEWVIKEYGNRWTDYGTAMADMVPISHGGNRSSNVPNWFRVLKRKRRGEYCLIEFNL
jgi:hypothetical protein